MLSSWKHRQKANCLSTEKANEPPIPRSKAMKAERYWVNNRSK
ncbi:hypothetical protein SynBIOSE41_02792 [Synechococcus sp. BIOS-E4-1]|nr:hypothetical protein SynBIOSE41_02792 [Synechococcus sp. BIOS-E4-1]